MWLAFIFQLGVFVLIAQAGRKWLFSCEHLCLSGFGTSKERILKFHVCWMAWKGCPVVSTGGIFLLLVCVCVAPVEAPRPPTETHRHRELIARGLITEQTRSLRLDLLKKMTEWFSEELPTISLEDLCRYHIDSLSEWLEEYMIHVYFAGHTRQVAAESLNALTQQYGWLRTVLATPWNVVKTWEVLEPSRHHPPIPKQVMFALAATAMAWDWPKTAALLVIGFFGLLRPSELILLRRRDLALPMDHWEEGIANFRVGAPKTRFKAAKDQHVRIDEPLIADWLNQIFLSTPSWSRIWRGSLAAFKSRFNRLQSEVLQQIIYVPACLRSGGATYLFRLWGENLQRLQWRGRWRSARMLEIYVREVGAAEIWVAFPHNVRTRVTFLGTAFSRFLHAAGCRMSQRSFPNPDPDP